MRLRPYQLRTQQEVLRLWSAGARAVAASIATGGGKTVTAMALVPQLAGSRGVVQAHRAELVGQLSVALGAAGVRHNLTVSNSTRRQIVELHFERLGRSMYDPGAAWSVESVDTAIRRKAREDVTHVISDECHHVLPANKWGRAVAMYPQARVLGLSATMCRADGQGLGVEAGGLFNAMVLGPGAAELMRDGYLCEYDVKVAVPGDLDMSQVQVTASGELNMQQAARAVHGSRRIVGDAVTAYQQHAPGKLCICFAVDIASARELTERYAAAGVPAALVTGEDLDADRAHVLRRFAARELLVLVNVDLFGEGFDVPGVEVVQMCRPTASFSLFSQQVGRCLRLDIDGWQHEQWDTFDPTTRRAYIAASRKPRALVLDHVGNFYTEYRIGDARHVGPPELFTAWDLSGRTKRASGGAIPMRTCLECFLPYERYLSECPACGTPAPAPEPGKAAAHVDGNLYDYDPQLLARLRAEVARIDGPPLVPQHLAGPAALAVRNKWHERQLAQQALREHIAVWAGQPERASRTEAELHREFYLRYGIDVLGAMALGVNEANKLIERITAQ